uniref:Alpha-galactosidase n=1 Tax=Schistocephalus solidus TaxID=70667 RepID=A0A0X3Q2B0_SCHSO
MCCLGSRFGKLVCLHLLLFLGFIMEVECLDNGLARTPPMGWMSWQRYRCQTDCVNYPTECINEDLIRRTAEHMARDGWLSKGYQYIVIDDCWPEMERDPSTKRLRPNSSRFPSGMKNLSDFVHSLGLKFGIYLDFGTKTCEGYPGSMDFLEIDAQTMADWDVDYIKMDGCYSDASVQALGYHAFSRFLNGTGRPIVFSCSYPAYEPWKEPAFPFNWTMLQEDCNLWRMLDDVQDSWASVLGIIGAYEKYHITLALNAGPGHWNDPDMLLLGNYGLSSDQQRVQMGMWVMFAAPLLISTDLGAISDESKQLLQSDLLLQINQDPLGLQALFHYTIGGIKIWTRRLSNNGVAIAFLNPSDSSGGPVRIVVALKQLEVFETDPPYCLTDAFSGKIFAIVDLDTPFEVRINPSGIILLIVQSLN